MGSSETDLPVVGRSKEDEPKCVSWTLQANTFVIPPYIIAEAMSSLHGSLDLRWSGPITPSEMLYVEQYVQARYPEYYGGAIGKDFLWKADEESSEVGGSGSSTPRDRQASPGFGGIRDYSPSFGNAPSELRKTQLNEPSWLRELLMKRALMPDTSISVPEMHARNRVLKFCGVTDDDYLVVFATAVQEAMRMVGEGYPFFKSNCYMSVLEEKVDDIKVYAVHNEAKFIQAPASWLDLRITGSQLSQHFRRKSKYTPKGLFAYPLEINGTRNSLHWISEAQRSLWHVLLDCSGLVLGDNHLILNLHKPDFVLCSTFKVPNQPNKVTCLLVRRNSFFITAPQ